MKTYKPKLRVELTDSDLKGLVGELRALGFGWENRMANHPAILAHPKVEELAFILEQEMEAKQ